MEWFTDTVLEILKHFLKMRNVLKVNDKDTWTTSSVSPKVF